jgi:hypothetical protein
MDDPIEVLNASGWVKARANKHQVWKCPCGKHQISFSCTPSDWRAYKNFMRDLIGTGCPSVEWLNGSEEEVVEGGTCKICGMALEPSGYKKKWIEHDGVRACIGHPGVGAWNRSYRGHGEDKGQEAVDEGEG